MKSEHTILLLCEVFTVSCSGYYGWQKRRTEPGLRAREDQTLCQDIQKIHDQSRQTYGSPRVLAELRKKGKHHGRNRVARLMKRERPVRPPERPLPGANHRQQPRPAHCAQSSGGRSQPHGAQPELGRGHHLH